MPRRNRNSLRPRSAANHWRRNFLILAATVGIAIILIAIVYGSVTPRAASPSAVAFPAREMGDSSAKIVVEEFADFQCPYCGRFSTDAEPRLRLEYVQTGKIRFIFRNYPVVGAESNLAAQAALCAGDQDVFWAYHDLLYQNQGAENSGAFSTPRLELFAAQMHLDEVAFDQCLSNQVHANVIADDVLLGRHYGIPGTPAFFINGRQVTILARDTQFQALFDAIGKALQS